MQATLTARVTVRSRAPRTERRPRRGDPPRATPEWKALASFGDRASGGSIGMRWRYQDKLRDVCAVLTLAPAPRPYPPRT